mgnify:CR=1 FL=1
MIGSFIGDFAIPITKIFFWKLSQELKPHRADSIVDAVDHPRILEANRVIRERFIVQLADTAFGG